MGSRHELLCQIMVKVGKNRVISFCPEQQLTTNIANKSGLCSAQLKLILSHKFWCRFFENHCRIRQFRHSVCPFVFMPSLLLVFATNPLIFGGLGLLDRVTLSITRSVTALKQRGDDNSFSKLTYFGSSCAAAQALT